MIATILSMTKAQPLHVSDTARRHFINSCRQLPCAIVFTAYIRMRIILLILSE